MPHAFEGYSRAMYSNWFWHRPLQLIVDAGEGLPLALGTNAFTASVIAITHGHSDHVLGLPGLAGARRFGKGATSKPWTVVYPEGCHAIDVMRHTIAELWRGVEFPITWTALAPGARFALSGPRLLESFSVTHVRAGARRGLSRGRGAPPLEAGVCRSAATRDRTSGTP